MKGILQLNNTCVFKNPVLGSHDPSMMWDPVTKMYYSAAKAFGSSESRIWLSVSDRPEGPFENRGVVADTWGTDDTFPNAIDPHIVRDRQGTWLVYGSFFGGIFIKELDEKNGMSKDGNSKSPGICISRKSSPARIDGPEGASVIYYPETGYFYLFQSYGWLGMGRFPGTGSWGTIL